MTGESRSWRDAALVGLTVLTSYTTAISWQAQAVSYPLFRAVGQEMFATYHQQYNDDIWWPVLIPGFPTVIACALFFWIRPARVGRPLAAVVTASGIVSLLLTLLWAIPMHDRLDEQGPAAATIDSLLQANLLRSVVLTVCTVLLGWAVLGNQRSAASR
jgi:hypothetical protein